MVRTYVRKTDRQNWTIESMEQAIEATENDDIQVGSVDAIANLPFKISVIDIRPLPKTTTSIEKTNRQKGKIVILTSIPYKNELQERIEKKEEAENKKKKSKEEKSQNLEKKKRKENKEAEFRI
ncbi:hypothetical protein JTB14_029394 [Gonioctena quinquepunctata]|nr:hypothetical protein JTB14_029394 [Gonioctena quinquepunctata]